MKKLYKFLNLILAVAIILISIPFSTLAAGATISFDNSSVSVGEAFTVTVTFASEVEMYALSCIVNYDESALSYVSGNASGSSGTLKIVEVPSDTKRVSCSLKFIALSAGSTVISVEDCVYCIFGENGAVEQEFSGASATVTVNEAESVSEFWSYDDENKILTIGLDGRMEDYSTDYTAVSWWEYKDEITSLIVLDGTTYIGNNAFSKMTALKSVVLPESVVEIGESAFSDCKLLETINIPSQVKEIKNKAFYNCNNLINADFSNIVSVGDYAFYRCNNLEAVDLSNAVYIGNYSFNSCSGLKEAVFSESLSCIGECAFAYCAELSVAEIPETVDFVDETAFVGCEKLLKSDADIDGDGVLGASDLTLIRRILLGESHSYNADVNGDGAVDVRDLVHIKRLLADE